MSILQAGVCLSGVLTRANRLGRSACQAMLVSVDGVLVQTRSHRVAAWQQIAEELLFPFDPALGQMLPDLAPMEALERLLGPAARDIDTVEKQLMLERQQQHYRLLLGTISPADVIAGGRAFVAGARSAGIRLAALASDVPELLARAGVAEWFDAIFDGRVLDPGALSLAAKSLGAANAQTVVLTGCDATLRAARQAGMRTVGIAPQRSSGFLPDAMATRVGAVTLEQVDSLVDPAAAAETAPAA